MAPEICQTGPRITPERANLNPVPKYPLENAYISALVQWRNTQCPYTPVAYQWLISHSECFWESGSKDNDAVNASVD